MPYDGISAELLLASAKLSQSGTGSRERQRACHVETRPRTFILHLLPDAIDAAASDYVAKYSAPAAEAWARSKGATDAEIPHLVTAP